MIRGRSEDQIRACGLKDWSGVGGIKRMEDPGGAKEVKGQGKPEGPEVHGEAKVRLEGLGDNGGTGRIKDHGGSKGSQGPVGVRGQSEGRKCPGAGQRSQESPGGVSGGRRAKDLVGTRE